MKRQADRARAIRKLIERYEQSQSSQGDLGSRIASAMSQADGTVGPAWRVEIALGGQAEAFPAEDYAKSAEDSRTQTAKFYEKLRQALSEFGDSAEEAKFDEDEAQTPDEAATRRLMAKIEAYTKGHKCD